MKKRVVSVLSLVMALMLYAESACGEATPLLYQVTDQEGHILYLLGTIHVGEEDMYPLSKAVQEAYQDADILAVEMDVFAVQKDIAQMMQYSMALMYTGAETAKDHLSEEIYTLGVKNLGYPEAVIRRMRPFAWLSLAQEQCYSRIGQSAELGVDMMLLKNAHETGKTIHELEGMASQMETMMSMPEEIVEFQLQQFLLYPDAADLSMKMLCAAWRQGNEEMLSLLLNQEAEGMPQELQDEYALYMDTLLHRRDTLFEEKAIEYLQSGNTVLFSVGAAHIVGEGALADRLEKAGYTVKEIGR